jgi:hypothetical protein
MSIFPFDTNALIDRYAKLRDLPKNDFEKRTILLAFLNEFTEKIYNEQEVK